jgi:hypothetical protein
MMPMYGEHCLSHQRVHNWVYKFSEGRTSIEDERGVGRLVEIATPANNFTPQVSRDLWNGVFKCVWRLRWKANVVCMSLPPFVYFQSRFVTCVLTFPLTFSSAFWVPYKGFLLNVLRRTLRMRYILRKFVWDRPRKKVTVYGERVPFLLYHGSHTKDLPDPSYGALTAHAPEMCVWSKSLKHGGHFTLTTQYHFSFISSPIRGNTPKHETAHCRSMR